MRPTQPPPAGPAPLPPIESLTPESDFTPFMGKDVEGDVRARALKTLFQDPRFNVMDGLDVYIDDYSKPDPLPEGWLEKMNQATRLGDYGAVMEAEEKARAEAQAQSALEEGQPAPPSDAACVQPAALPPPDTAAGQSTSSEMPESAGKPPRKPGQMV